MCNCVFEQIYRVRLVITFTLIRFNFLCCSINHFFWRLDKVAYVKNFWWNVNHSTSLSFLNFLMVQFSVYNNGFSESKANSCSKVIVKAVSNRKIWKKNPRKVKKRQWWALINNFIKLVDICGYTICGKNWVFKEDIFFKAICAFCLLLLSYVAVFYLGRF